MFDTLIQNPDIPIPMELYLVISTVMFFAGLFGFLSRKNMLMVLISAELMLNAANLNFCVFNRYLYNNQLEGFFFSMFSIAIAAAEVAIAIAIIINVFRKVKNVYIDDKKISTMKH